VKSIIHVNQAVIARNRKTGANDPPLIVRNYKGAVHAQRVYINGPSVLVNSPHKPLACGARVWLETQAKIEVVT
jgi:hypothetical protein